MANKFNIIITATDRATAIVRKVKDAISQFTRPIRQVMGSFKKFGKEIGLDRLAKGFVSVAKFAGGAAMKILGAGAALAGIAAVASVTALAEWVRAWADGAATLSRTTTIIGLGTTRIQTLTGAAELFGLKSEDMVSGLQNVGDAMQDAVFGRNQQTMVMMNRLHIQLRRTKDGAVDTAQALMDVSRAIVRQHGAQQQAVIARAFGLESLLPLLQKGPAYIADLEAKVRATHALLDPDAIKRATEFQQKIALLTKSIDGLGNSISNRLLPFLAPAISKLTQFIEKISDAIIKHQEAILIGEGLGAIGRTIGVAPRAPLKPGGKSRPPWIQWNPKGTPLEYNWLNPFMPMRSAYDRYHKPTAAELEALTATHGGPHKPVPPNAYNQRVDTTPLKRGDFSALLQKLHGNVNEAIVSMGGNADLLKRYQASHDNAKTLPVALQKLLSDVASDPNLLAVIRGDRQRGGSGGRPPAAAPATGGTIDLHVHGLPLGTRVTAKGSMVTNAKIAHAMPDLSTP